MTVPKLKNQDNPTDEQIVFAWEVIIGGGTLTELSKKFKKDRMTIHRWKKTRWFHRIQEEFRRQSLDLAKARFAVLTEEAYDAYRRLLRLPLTSEEVIGDATITVVNHKNAECVRKAARDIAEIAGMVETKAETNIDMRQQSVKYVSTFGPSGRVATTVLDPVANGSSNGSSGSEHPVCEPGVRDEGGEN